MTFGKLVTLELTSGMNQEGQGIVTIAAVAEDGRIFKGQLEPSLVRGLGQTCFTVAEAADSDAIVFSLLQRKFELDIPSTVSFINDIREAREERNDAA